MRRSPTSLAIVLAVTSMFRVSVAQEGLQEVPEAAPPPPSSIEDGQALEPDVTIVQRKDATVEEYRLNGRLYMIRVTPFIGKPYYLIDNNGDGLLESKISDLQRDPIVPQWVIFSW